LEGLQAALSFLPSDHEVRERIESAVPHGISFLLRAQISEGAFSGAFPRAVDKVYILQSDEFNRRTTEVRIDYVQHALSATIQYYENSEDRATAIGRFPEGGESAVSSANQGTSH